MRKNSSICVRQMAQPHDISYYGIPLNRYLCYDKNATVLTQDNVLQET